MDAGAGAVSGTSGRDKSWMDLFRASTILCRPVRAARVKASGEAGKQTGAAPCEQRCLAWIAKTIQAPGAGLRMVHPGRLYPK